MCMYLCLYAYIQEVCLASNINSEGNWSYVKVYCMYFLAFTYLFKPNFACAYTIQYILQEENSIKSN